MAFVMVTFCPQVHNIAILSECQALADIERDYVADPSAKWLFSRNSFLGRTVISLTDPFEWLGWCSSKRNMDAVLQTSKVALEQLKQYLLCCSEEPIEPISTFVSLSFDERWQKKIRSADRLLTGQTDFPSFEKAQGIVAPIILQEITRADIPWDLFDSILKHQKLEAPAERRLAEWIGDVVMWGAYISPFLLLSMCEAAAVRSFPDQSIEQRSSHAFFLAWALYKAGLLGLLSSDENFPEIAPGAFVLSESQECLRFGSKIRLSFPLDFPVTAYQLESEERSSLMIVQSSSPLFLGMWMHRISECSSVIPCFHTVAIDHRGRYMVSERLTASLEDSIWEGDGSMTAQDTRLMGKFAELCKRLIRLPVTFELEVDHIFITSQGEIRSVTPLQVRESFFCLPMVEKFIRDVCHEDQKRIRLLLERAELWSHPSVQVYRSLLENFTFEATGPDIRRELIVFELSENNSANISDWMRVLRRHAGRIREAISDLPRFIAVPYREQMALIAKTVLQLQKEDGWISCIPSNLSERVLSKIA